VATERRRSGAERRTLVVLGAGTGVLFGTGMAIVLATTTDRAPIWLAVAVGLAAGTAFGSAMSAFFARVWTRAGGLRIARAVQHALRTRRLPDDADPQTWSELLDRQERDTRRAPLYVLFFAVLAVLYLVLALAGTLPDLGVLPWVGVALFLGFAVYAPLEARSRRARISSLREQIARRAAESH